MGGDESGVAFRALMAPRSRRRAAHEAMLANGLNFKNYQKNRTASRCRRLSRTSPAQYGVKLNKDAQAGLGKIAARI
jgi:hypothetical protein